MNYKSLLQILLFVLVFSCNKKSEEGISTEGSWYATWKTLPESYPGITDVDFTMNGSFNFEGENVTIIANGYPGCIFNIDTIEHSQNWKISNDTLYLFSDPEVISLSYKIKKLKEDSIELQLMEDIFVTLSK